MRHTSLFSALALAGAILATGCSELPTTPTLARTVASADKATDAGGSALYFNGFDANASTTLGTIVSTPMDNITISATVRFDGPNAYEGGDDHQVIYYNGYGAVTGWGIIVENSGGGFADGTVCVLAGGIVVASTPLILPRGQWVDVSATRTDGNVTVTVGDQSYDLGYIPVNPVGGFFADAERTSVGGDGVFDGPSGVFHGAVKSVDIRSGNHWIEKWRFAGHGSTSTGNHGSVLQLGTASWIQGND